MRMKAFQSLSISVCALALLLGTIAFAQDNTTQAPPPPNPPAARHHGPGGPGGRLQQMAQYLNLTDEQKTQIQPILQNESQQLKALRNDTSLSPDQRKAKLQEIRQATRTQIEPILTPDQVAKLGKGQGAGPRAGMKGRPQGNPVAWMSKNLNLTDDQKSKLEPLFADQQKQVQAIRQDSTLTDQQKRAKIDELRKSNHQQVMSILTPEQQQQMKQMRKQQMHRNGPPPAGATPPTSAPPAPPSGF